MDKSTTRYHERLEKRKEEIYLNSRKAINANKDARKWHRKAVQLIIDHQELIREKFPTGVIGDRFEYLFVAGSIELSYWGDLGKYPISDQELYDQLKSEIGI